MHAGPAKPVAKKKRKKRRDGISSSTAFSPASCLCLNEAFVPLQVPQKKSEFFVPHPRRSVIPSLRVSFFAPPSQFSAVPPGEN